MLWFVRKGEQDLNKTLTIKIWERDFTLPIEYDCYEGEDITEEQIEALKTFASHKNWIEASKGEVEAFCRDQVLEDEENQKKDNIFSYIKPDYIFVKRDEKNARVAIMCKYRYEPEHGLAIVFMADGEITVGIQDIIL